MTRMMANTGKIGAIAARHPRRILADRLEELSDLPAPSRNVGGKDGRLCVVEQLLSAGVLHRRPTQSCPVPTARRLRTHCVVPRGATR